MAANKNETTTSVEEMTLDEAMEQLDAIVEQMEEEGQSIEESFACYEQGVKLVAACNEKLDRMEKKLQILQADGTVAPAEFEEDEEIPFS